MPLENPVAQQNVSNITVCVWSGSYSTNHPSSSLQQRLKSSLEMAGTAHVFKVKNVSQSLKSISKSLKKA